MVIIASGFLVWCAGTWAFAFYRILRDGEVRFYEPNIVMLITEFTVAVALALVGVTFIVLVTIKAKKSTKPKELK